MNRSAGDGGGLVPLSRLGEMLQPDAFLWATGIEDTFITAPHPQTGRILEEYELTEHYGRWEQDFQLMKSLGVPAARYGIPWYKVQPIRNQWDWSWADKTLDRLQELGIDPIIDLVHYGVPDWLEQSLVDQDFPEAMAEYAGRFAERFKGRIHWYTPLNEPRINAWYAGKLGWWPPFLKNWAGFALITAKLSEAIIRASREIRRVDPENVICHVDASDIYFSENPDLQQQAEFRQKIVFLALDLVTNQLTHEMRAWLLKHKISETQLEWFETNSERPDVVGYNMYPIFSHKELRGVPGNWRFNVRYGTRKLVENIGRMYWERYRLPVMLSETATKGSPRKRIEWIHESMAGVRSLRQSGVPVIGYTWWPMFALISWGYRQGHKDKSHYMVQMGLWDLDGQMNRIETPVVNAFREAVSRGAELAGTLDTETTRRQHAV